MIRVDIDTNLPSVLQALADPALLDRAAYAAAESYNDDIHDWIDSGRAFHAHTGALEQSINWRPAGQATADVYAQAGYAGFVEKGTGPHVIEPKPGRKGLKIPVGGGGGYIIRRKVNHPGSRPYPFFFADLENRKQHMQQRVLSVLAAHAGGANG
jgi:hypothetical protein